jgi:DNA-binding LacI/PurR family transcriptional regulator
MQPTKTTSHRATIKDIARIAKTSTAAVSLALNNRPGVGEKTRRKILRIANKLGYRPNQFAKSLTGKGSDTIGLILENISDPFYAELALGTEEKASEMGYSLILANTGGSLSREQECLENFRARGVDGIILSTVTMDDPCIRPLVEDRFPFVCVNRYFLDPVLRNRVDSIVLDNYACGYQGLQHLYRLGHDRIALIAGTPNSATAFMRTKGSVQAMEEHGLAKDPKLIVECGFLRERAHRAAKHLLAMKRPPTAFFCQDDTMAIGVREAVLSAGLRIPQDIALMGMNDIEVASLQGVDLTTIRQNIYQMGNTSAEILINRIRGKGSHMVNQVIINSELIVRRSCGFELRGYAR